MSNLAVTNSERPHLTLVTTNTQQRGTMIRTARRIYSVLAMAFLGSVVIQVFLAGTALFAGNSFELHMWFAAVVHLIPLLMLAAGAVGRVGRHRIGLVALLFVVVSVQVMLPALRSALPLAAALHPVGALAIFWMGILVVRGAPHSARAAAAPSEPVEPVVAVHGS